MYNTTLFASGELRDHCAKRMADLERYIGRLSKPEIEHDEGVLTAEVSRRFEIPPLVLREQEKRHETSESTVAYQDALGRGTMHRPAVRVSVHLPFDGNDSLLGLCPSERRLSGRPAASIDRGAVMLVQDFPGVPTPNDVQRWYQSAIESLRWWVESVNRDVAAHNVAVAQAIPGLLQARRAQLDSVQWLHQQIDLDGLSG